MAQIIAGGTKPDSGGNVEVITQTQTTTWTQLQGKPYILVSSKGIVNGLSNIPNDGADFGPDTTLGATAPGQYGSPYTETMGGQESVNYALSISITNPPDIYFSPGIFYLSAPIVYKQTTINQRWHFPNLHGAGSSGFGTSPRTTGTTFMPTSSFPAGEYHLAILQDDTGGNTTSAGTTIEGINLYGKDSSGTLLAAGFISDCLGFSNVYMSIEYTIAPNPTLTKSVLEASYGAFNFGTTAGAGTTFNLINVQVRGGGLDGIYNRASQSIYSGGYSSGNARYGILDYDTGSTSGYGERTVYINSPASGFQEATFTGTLPSFMPSSAPKTANFAIVGSALSVYDYEDFEGANEAGPAVYIYQAAVDFFGGNITGAFSPTSTLSWPVIAWDTNAGFVNFYGTTFSWNQDYQYLISGYYYGSNVYVMQFFGGIFAANGTLPSDISGVINPSSLLQTSGIIHFSNVLFNGTIYPSPFTLTPTSGDTYQNTYGRTLWIYSQITLSPTTTAAATAYLRIGTSSTAGANPIVDEISIPAGLTSGFIITLKAPLYAGQYYEIDVTNATIGTTTGITNSD